MKNVNGEVITFSEKSGVATNLNDGEKVIPEPTTHKIAQGKEKEAANPSNGVKGTTSSSMSQQAKGLPTKEQAPESQQMIDQNEVYLTTRSSEQPGRPSIYSHGTTVDATVTSAAEDRRPCFGDLDYLSEGEHFSQYNSENSGVTPTMSNISMIPRFRSHLPIPRPCYPNFQQYQHRHKQERELPKQLQGERKRLEKTPPQWHPAQKSQSGAYASGGNRYSSNMPDAGGSTTYSSVRPYPVASRGSNITYNNNHNEHSSTHAGNLYGITNISDQATAVLGNVYNTNNYYNQEDTITTTDTPPGQQQAFIAGLIKLASRHGILLPSAPIHKDKDEVSRWVREVYEAQMCATTVWDEQTAIVPPSIGTSMAYIDQAELINHSLSRPQSPLSPAGLPERRSFSPCLDNMYFYESIPNDNRLPSSNVGLYPDYRFTASVLNGPGRVADDRLPQEQCERQLRALNEMRFYDFNQNASLDGEEIPHTSFSASSAHNFFLEEHHRTRVHNTTTNLVTHVPERGAELSTRAVVLFPKPHGKPKGISPMGQALFKAFSRTMPTRWQGTSMVVSDTFIIDNPFSGPASITLVDGATGDIERMRRVLDMERNKIELKLGKELLDKKLGTVRSSAQTDLFGGSLLI